MKEATYKAIEENSPSVGIRATIRRHADRTRGGPVERSQDQPEEKVGKWPRIPVCSAAGRPSSCRWDVTLGLPLISHNPRSTLMLPYGMGNHRGRREVQ